MKKHELKKRRRANDFNIIFNFTVRYCSERCGVKALRLDPANSI